MTRLHEPRGDLARAFGHAPLFAAAHRPAGTSDPPRRDRRS
ncbi:hypothetical protein [Mycobacterium sp. E2733]|nr:hypothetical protein [Mycobacterium sp. E2733]